MFPKPKQKMTPGNHGLGIRARSMPRNEQMVKLPIIQTVIYDQVSIPNHLSREIYLGAYGNEQTKPALDSPELHHPHDHISSCDHI